MEIVKKLIERNCHTLSIADPDGFGFTKEELGRFIEFQLMKLADAKTEDNIIWDITEAKHEPWYKECK